MSLVLNRRDVEERLQAFAPDQYKYIYGIMKNVALGFGAYTLVTFLGEPQTFVPRISFWAASVATIMVSHVTAARGILLTSFRYSWADTVFPLALGIIECILFLVLQPNKDYPHLWYCWYLAIALHMLVVVGLVWNRIAQTVEDDFEPDLRPLVQRYVTWLRADLTGAAILCGITVIAGLILVLVVLPRWPGAEFWQFIPGVILLVAMVVVIAKAESERRELITFLRAPSDTVETLKESDGSVA